MIRKAKIKELKLTKIIPPISQKLESLGFKYVKSKMRFQKKHKNFTQYVSVGVPQVSPFTYDESKQELYLSFFIRGYLEYSKFSKWYKDKTGLNNQLGYATDSVHSKAWISLDEFNRSDFFDPTDSQRFKHKISLALSRQTSNNDKEIFPFDTILNEKLELIVEDLDRHTDPIYCYQNPDFKAPFHFAFWLLQEGHKDIAIPEIHRQHKVYFEQAKEAVEQNTERVDSHVQYFKHYIKVCKALADIDFENPFSISLNLKTVQDRTLKITDAYRFKEFLSIDISSREINRVNISPSGEIFVFFNQKTIIKFDQNGKVLLEYQINHPDGFRGLSWDTVSGFIQSHQIYYLNNVLIFENNEVVILPIPKMKQKNNSLQSYTITEIVAPEGKDFLLVLYHKFLLKYSFEGVLLEKTEFPEFGKKIILEKGWIMANNKIYDFQAKFLHEFKVGRGNTRFFMSNSLDNIVYHGYSTKSQLYNISTQKKQALWAHPTYINGYKEQLYNDIEHNFDLIFGLFAPGDSYIVGSGHHGKYVAWTYPQLERVELIPKPETVASLQPQITTRFSNGKSWKKITKPEVIEIEGKKFLKNRGNYISKVRFLEDGKYFLTEIYNSKIILLWNNKFEHIDTISIDGSTLFHGDDFISISSKDELVLYKRIE